MDEVRSFTVQCGLDGPDWFFTGYRKCRLCYGRVDRKDNSTVSELFLTLVPRDTHENPLASSLKVQS